MKLKKAAKILKKEIDVLILKERIRCLDIVLRAELKNGIKEVNGILIAEFDVSMINKIKSGETS